jgi:protein-S-isoprenylcysteine O-methyltransferase Ste14
MLFQTIDFIALASKNPEILNERGKFLKEGTKSYDEKFVVFYLIGVLAAMIIMGLDAARFKWYPLPNWGLLFGLIFILPGYVLGLWAMVSNPFFELTGRIQKEREHEVIDEGPYQFIRHPGYAGEIIMLMGTPFILQSLLGYIPIIGLIILFVIRTSLEDKTLKKELPGYKNYSKKTKYRLLPHIW